MSIKDFPKVELHLHLDCSLSFEVASRIDPSLSRAAYDHQFIGPVRCHDLADFLTRAQHGIRLMQTKDQLELVTGDLFHQLRNDGVIYAEIRFAPLLHTEKGLSPEEVVGIVSEAAEAARAETGVDARLILCTLRHFSKAQSLETARLVDQFRGSLVAGLDIAGDEAGFPLQRHVAAFEYVRERNIPCTAHAGEACGPDSVWETLRMLAPQRIGHGVRSAEDPGLLDYLVNQGIHLEICPSSNIQTNVYRSISDHPVDDFYHRNLHMSINTDARTITNVTLTKEYNTLQACFQWGSRQFEHCSRMAIEAAFLPAVEKENLLMRLKENL